MSRDRDLTPDEVQAALRVLSGTRKEELEYMDDVERNIYMNSIAIITDYNALKRNKALKQLSDKQR